MIYDMPMIAAAVAIDWKARADAGVPIKIPEVVLVVALFTCVLGMIENSAPFAASVLLFLLFLVIARSREAVSSGGIGLASPTSANLTSVEG
jgi:alpha-1,2-mannosyltransferase